METEQITGKIQSALKICAEKHGIEYKDIRIRLRIEKGFVMNSLICDVLNKTEVVDKKLDLKEVLGVTPIQEPLVKAYLKDTLCKIGEKEGVKSLDVNARFFTKVEDFFPRLFLYNGGNPVREVKIEELKN